MTPVSVEPGTGVNCISPFTTVAMPTAAGGGVLIVRVSGSFSGSESFDSTSKVAVLSCGIESASSTATGAAFAGLQATSLTTPSPGRERITYS